MGSVWNDPISKINYIPEIAKLNISGKTLRS